MAVHRRVSRPAQSRTTAPIPRCTKDAGKPAVSRRMPGAGLSLWRSGKAPPDRPAFQPYWGKPAVRNERGDRGNVGIIRSPDRASFLPDCQKDGCDEFTILAADRLTTTDEGTLFKTRLKTFHASYSGRQDRAEETGFVFCSPTRPAIM